MKYWSMLLVYGVLWLSDCISSEKVIFESFSSIISLIYEVVLIQKKECKSREKEIILYCIMNSKTLFVDRPVLIINKIYSYWKKVVKLKEKLKEANQFRQTVRYIKVLEEDKSMR